MTPEDSMRFDTSFHPIDLRFIHGSLVPALLSGDGLDGLEASAARKAKVRYLAKAWALGALGARDAARQQAERAARALPRPEPARPGLLGRLFGGKSSLESRVEMAVFPPWLDRLDPELHLSGRPYFITAAQPAEVSAAIDTWLAAAPEDAESLGRAMALRLAPEFGPLTEPELRSGLPSDAVFRQLVAEPISACREVLRTLEAGEMFAHPDGGELDPADLIGPDFVFLLVRIGSWFRPGWMDRGACPSHLMPEIPGAAHGWEPATTLLAPILERHPRLQPSLEPTITANHRVGGMLRAEDVPRLRAALESAEARLLSEGLGARSWQKLREALLDAESRGLPFLEATDVYSEQGGVLN